MSDQPAPAPRRQRADQDRALANRINQYRTALIAAQGNAELIELLAGRGYDAAALAAGLALCEAAQTAFTARQQAMAAQSEAAIASRAADEAARSGFDDFRKIARALFKTNPAARQSLGVDGRPPDDREQFLTAASAAYSAALADNTLLTALARRGYPQAALEAEQGKLAALTTASAAHDRAQDAAKRATATRDSAAKALTGWWLEFQAVAKVALKNRSDLWGQLGL